MRELGADEFKTEHVIPQAFGKFEANLTLNACVCGECNQYFGDTLELIFARDIIIGESGAELLTKTLML